MNLFEQAKTIGSYDVVVAGGGPARIMSTCMAMGQAAGTATMLKLKENCSYRNVDVRQLRSLFRESGAEVDC